jgi:hypothetical protein
VVVDSRLIYYLAGLLEYSNILEERIGENLPIIVGNPMPPFEAAFSSPTPLILWFGCVSLRLVHLAYAGA